MIKKHPLSKVSTEEMFLKIIKAIYNQSTANIMLYGEKQSSSLKIRNKTRITFTTVSKRNTGSTGHIQPKRDFDKETLSLFLDD